MSCINDLLNRNWGRVISAISSDQGGFSLFDTGGVSRACTMYTTGNSLFTVDLVSIGTRCQLGQGSNPATRSDNNIQTPFVGGVESSQINTGDGGYNSGLGKVDVPTLFSPTLGSGSISETVLFGVWSRIGNIVFTCCITRDNISPVVNFVGGQAVNVDYSLLFN